MADFKSKAEKYKVGWNNFESHNQVTKAEYTLISFSKRQEQEILNQQGHWDSGFWHRRATIG